MAKIADVLREKGSAVRTVEASATVFDAIREMVESSVGSLLVTEAGAICGILTERDYLRRVALEGRTSKTTAVRDIMSAPVLGIHPDADIEDAMALVTSRRIRHLPVFERGALLGIVSIGDLVKHMSRERKFEIQKLTEYIAGKYPA